MVDDSASESSSRSKRRSTASQNSHMRLIAIEQKLELVQNQLDLKMDLVLGGLSLLLDKTSPAPPISTTGFSTPPPSQLHSCCSPSFTPMKITLNDLCDFSGAGESTEHEKSIPHASVLQCAGKSSEHEKSIPHVSMVQCTGKSSKHEKSIPHVSIGQCAFKCSDPHQLTFADRRRLFSNGHANVVCPLKACEADGGTPDGDNGSLDVSIADGGNPDCGDPDSGHPDIGNQDNDGTVIHPVTVDKTSDVDNDNDSDDHDVGDDESCSCVNSNDDNEETVVP